jgi:hypothetical protein
LRSGLLNAGMPFEVASMPVSQLAKRTPSASEGGQCQGAGRVSGLRLGLQVRLRWPHQAEDDQRDPKE